MFTVRDDDAPEPIGREAEVRLAEKMLWDLKEVVQMVGLSATTITRFRDRGDFPEPTRLGRRILWRPKDIYEWVKSKGPGRRGVR